MTVSDKIRTWLEAGNRPVGAVVHTLDGKKPVRATHVRQGEWTFEPEQWVHES